MLNKFLFIVIIRFNFQNMLIKSTFCLIVPNNKIRKEENQTVMNEIIFGINTIADNTFHIS